MALYLSNLTDAYGPILESHWEKKEDPQHYDQLTSQLVHPDPKRHILGLVGGNEASLIKGNLVDLESDLRRINIPNTFAPYIRISNSKESRTIKLSVFSKENGRKFIFFKEQPLNHWYPGAGIGISFKI